MKTVLCAFVLTLLAALPAAATGEIVSIELHGSINPISRDYVVRALEDAAASGAVLVLIELNTPGGLESSMRDIITAQLASSVPIVIYVAPPGARAASAGAFITLAADVAAMAPGTNIGAAHPVSLIGTEGETASPSAEKAVSDSAAFARAIAERRGRNIEWAERAVRESSSLSASEALAENVIDLVAENRTDLLSQLDGYTLPDGRVLTTAGRAIREVRPNLRERLLGLLADPNVVYVLFILGLYGLIYEFFQPGVGLGLAGGGVCLLLAFFGLQILPVNIAGILLVLFGAGLMVLDAFTPTDGILTAGGVIALVAGSLILFDIPDRSVGLSLGTVAAVASVTAALSLFVLSKGLVAQRRRPATGKSALIGALGTVRRELAPEGAVFIKGEYWTARTLEERIPVGARVRVERVEGRILFVRGVR